MPLSRMLRDHALQIWQAGVDAVRSDLLVRNVVQRDGAQLIVARQRFNLCELGRIAVVGAGKAGAGMAAAVEDVLGTEILNSKTVGWINVPADCVRPLQRIHLHAARPAGVNEPTKEGVDGAREILRIVGDLQASDLCIVLISGGGSALLPAPKPPITLEEKQAVTRFLMHAGATINELNTVRKRLSEIKGGGLARASRAGSTISLIISDVVGDPLDIIASGPTVPDPATNADALAVLERFAAQPPAVPERVLDFLKSTASETDSDGTFSSSVSNYVIGNNQTAVTAASDKARKLGYEVISLGSANEGDVNKEGRSFAEQCLRIRDGQASIRPPACLLSGGEPTVRVTQTDQPRKGGRNQQFVLAGVEALLEDGMNRIAILAGGTDGEDGPTDAAGAVADADLIQFVRERKLDPSSYLAINDSYTFFDQVAGLIRTGPTHTNVMDLRVGIVDE